MIKPDHQQNLQTRTHLKEGRNADKKDENENMDSPNQLLRGETKDTTRPVTRKEIRELTEKIEDLKITDKDKRRDIYILKQ